MWFDREENHKSLKKTEKKTYGQLLKLLCDSVEKLLKNRQEALIAEELM